MKSPWKSAVCQSNLEDRCCKGTNFDPQMLEVTRLNPWKGHVFTIPKRSQRIARMLSFQRLCCFFDFVHHPPTPKKIQEDTSWTCSCIICTWERPETSIYKRLFQQDDSKSLHRQWLFHHFHPFRKCLALGFQVCIIVYGLKRIFLGATGYPLLFKNRQGFHPISNHEQNWFRVPLEVQRPLENSSPKTIF